MCVKLIIFKDTKDRCWILDAESWKCFKDWDAGYRILDTQLRNDTTFLSI